MSSDSNARDEAVDEEHGFVWGATVDADRSPSKATDAAEPPSETGVNSTRNAGGFEWCDPVADADSDSDSDSDADSDSKVELRLDPSLTTETRLDGTDDEAVALLASLRRDPTYGRWRQVETELDEEPDGN
ncbi:hypothetical protein C2R22_11395 [Salinigranum rubrum]|uniref:Uncharacterized protein n=1 Tax=Salinigranum rubrum TaxID=755307 RepID=A0A2I8VJQ8_9EURY|nr:hypothetical protein [Salinigranum rubrum]AUV82177.1 hypothetical protein C2R22_11395 [Salinigranum rubrum]